MPRRKFIRGVIDPISLIGVLMLVITLVVGTKVTNDRSMSLNISEKAADCFDECRQDSGRKKCNSQCGTNINWKGEIVNEIDTSKVDKNVTKPGDPTCDANGVQYSAGAVVMYGGIGSNATCGSDGKWDVGVGATTDIKPENVPEYAKGTDKLEKQIEAEKQAAEQLVTEQQTVTPQITITPSTADQENLDREKSQCLQEGGSWFANICSYAEQQQAIAKLTPIIQEQQEQKTQAAIQTQPIVTAVTSPQVGQPCTNCHLSPTQQTQNGVQPPSQQTVAQVINLMNKDNPVPPTTHYAVINNKLVTGTVEINKPALLESLKDLGVDFTNPATKIYSKPIGDDCNFSTDCQSGKCGKKFAMSSNNSCLVNDQPLIDKSTLTPEQKTNLDNIEFVVSNPYSPQAAAMIPENYNFNLKNLNNYAACNGDETCNNILTSADTGFTKGFGEKWGNYKEDFAPDKVKYTWQEAGYDDVQACQVDMGEKYGLRGAQSCNTYQITTDQLTSSIKLGTDITAKAATIMALPEIVAAESLLAIPVTALIKYGPINALNQISNASVAQIETPGSKDAWLQTGQAGLSLLNLGSADYLMKTFGNTASTVQALNNAKNINTAVSAVNLVVDAPVAYSTCAQAGLLTTSCGGAVTAVAMDIGFGFLDYKQGQLGFGNPLSQVPNAPKIDVPDINGTRIANAEELARTMNIKNESVIDYVPPRNTEIDNPSIVNIPMVELPAAKPVKPADVVAEIDIPKTLDTPSAPKKTFTELFDEKITNPIRNLLQNDNDQLANNLDKVIKEKSGSYSIENSPNYINKDTAQKIANENIHLTADGNRLAGQSASKTIIDTPDGKYLIAEIQAKSDISLVEYNTKFEEYTTSLKNGDQMLASQGYSIAPITNVEVNGKIYGVQKYIEGDPLRRTNNEELLNSIANKLSDDGLAMVDLYNGNLIRGIDGKITFIDNDQVVSYVSPEEFKAKIKIENENNPDDFFAEYKNRDVETQAVEIPYSKELDPLIEVRNAWNKYGDRLTTAYKNQDAQGLIDIAKENGYQVKIVPFGEKVDIVEIGGKIGETTKMPMTKADTVRIGKSGGKKTLFIATTDVSNPTFKIDDLAHDIGAVITDVKFIPIEKIDISPYSFADFMTRATGEKWNASDIAKKFGTQLNGRTKSVEVPITYIVDALTFGEVPSNFLESVPVKPITGFAKIQEWFSTPVKPVSLENLEPKVFDVTGNNMPKTTEITIPTKIDVAKIWQENVLSKDGSILPKLNKHPSEKLARGITGLDIGDPELMPRLIDDHYIIKAKYNLPPREMRFDNPREYINQLNQIAKDNGVDVRNVSEWEEFFKTNRAGAVFDDAGNQIFVNFANETSNPIGYAGDLEHELIHGLQYKYSPGMPVEVMEYEAYVTANMRLNNKSVESENLQHVVFGNIKQSVDHWYTEKGLTNPWIQKTTAETAVSWIQDNVTPQKFTNWWDKKITNPVGDFLFGKPIPNNLDDSITSRIKFETTVYPPQPSKTYEMLGKILGEPKSGARVSIDPNKDNALSEFLIEGEKYTNKYSGGDHDKVELITEYVTEAFPKYNLSDHQSGTDVKEWVDSFYARGDLLGENIPIGKFIETGCAVCKEQAILLHTSLAYNGIDSTINGGQLGSSKNWHAWVEYINPEDGKVWIADSVWKFDLPYDEAAKVYGGISNKSNHVGVVARPVIDISSIPSQPTGLAAIPEKFGDWWDEKITNPVGDLIFGKKPIFLDNLDTPLPPIAKGNAPVMIKPNEIQAIEIPYSNELDPLIQVKNAWNKYGDRLTTAYKNQDAQGLIDIAKENGYQVKIVPFGKEVDIVEIGGKIGETTKMPITKADTVRIGKDSGKKTLFIATSDISNPTFKVDELAHDIGAVITDVKFISVEKIFISPYSFADFMTKTTGEKWRASDIAENFGTLLNNRTKSKEVPITRIVDALTFGDVPSNFLESVPVKPITGLAKVQEQAGAVVKNVLNGSVPTGVGFSPLKYVAGGIASAVFLDDYFDLGIIDYIQNNFVSTINHIYSDNEQKTKGVKLDSSKLEPIKIKKIITTTQKPEVLVQNARPSECVNKEILDTAVVGGDTGLRYDSKFRPNVVVINDIIKGATYDTWTAAELAPEAVDPVKKWVEWINEQGYSPFISSGYRSYETQEAYSRSYGNQAATPGGSCHQSGLCFDVHFYIDNKTGKRYDLCYDPNLPECLINMNAQEKAQELGIAHPYKWDQPHYMVAVAASPAILPFVQQQPLNKTYINSLNEELLKFQNSCNYTDENRFVSNP